MSATLTFWVVIVAVGALNYLSRLSFIAIFARIEMPAIVSRALRFVPAAMPMRPAQIKDSRIGSASSATTAIPAASAATRVE